MLAVSENLHKITNEERKTLNFRGSAKRWPCSEKLRLLPVESRRGADTADRRLDRLRYLFDDSQLLAADSSPRGVLAFAAAFPVSNPAASMDRDVAATGCCDRALA